MKKSLIALIFVLVAILAFGVVAIANEAEAKDITITYVKSQDTTSATTTLDTVAYAGGKQTVKAGEEFTLPLTADSSYVGQDGFQLVFYTEDGRTYKAGEAVSFDKDTKLFRCVAKECYTVSDVNYAMTNESIAAILMADITTNVGIDVRDQDMSALILNGHTINMTRNGDIIGNQRSGKQILGEGTLNVTSTDGKVGSYYVINSQGHGYNGTKNKSVVGRDVTINAPDFWLTQDWDGTNGHHPWIRIYGNIDVYGLMITTTGPTRTQLFEIFENAVVKINGPALYQCYYKSSNTQYYYNNHAIQTRIYGGTLYLPAEAENLSFWSDEYLEEFVVGSATYSPYEVTDTNRDSIKISGGSFVLPDNKVPAISSFLTEDCIQMMHDGGNGLVTNNNESTYYVPFHNKGAYKLVFSKYDGKNPAKLLVYDFAGNKTEYRYTSTKTADGKAIETLLIYEATVVDNGDGTTTTTYDKLTDDFVMVQGANFFVFKNAVTSADYKLQNLVANNTTFQVVVPAECEHNFAGEPVDATCAHAAYADYNCTECGHNVFFTWGEKLAHDLVLGEHIEATLTSLGSKSYECSMCGLAKTSPYNLDPSNLDVLVKIRLDDGTFEEITVKASEIFDFAASGSDSDFIYTLSAIKTFGDYKIRNIYGITIPKGIMFINIATQNYEKYNNVEYGVAELNIAEGAKVEVQNIGNLRRVEKITVGKNTDVVFCASCSYYNPNNERRDMQLINTIDLSAGNHSVVFMNSAFNGRSKIATLKLGENSSYEFKSSAFYNCAITSLVFPASNTYAKFGSSSFYGNDMESLVFPNGVDFTFGDSAFENCVTLTSVTFGENATYTLGNYTFRYCLIPKAVFAKNSTYTLGSQVFLNTALTEVDASAGNITLTMNNNAFNCTKDNKKYCELSVFKFGENSTYVISEGVFTYASFTEIVLAPNSNYTFKRYCINGTDNKNSFKTLDASADGITLTVEGESFRYHTAFDTLKINGKNGTYTFNTNAFMDTKIAEVTLGKGSTYVFNNCFNGSTPITKIDASADNLNVTVNAYGFGNKNITTLLINGKNGTYTFNSEAFRNSVFTELTLGEGSTYNFNSNCYSSTNNLQKIDASANNLTVIVANNVFNGKSAITSLDISGENSTYTFGQECFKNAKLTEVKFGANSTYDFGYLCFRDCSAIKTLDFTANNVTATFGNQAFDGRSTVTYIAFGENSTYTIGEYVFRNTAPTNDIVFSNTSTFKIGREAFRYADFASITFEDNINVEFTGVDAFKECDKAVTLYIGKNIAITNYPFRNLKALETLYIMEGVTHTSEYEFEYAGSSNYATPLYVYNHSLDLTFNKGMFKECDGIFLYTITDNIGTNGEVFANCGDTNGFKAWTVYLGLAHPLTNHVVDPDCVNIGLNTWIVDGTKCPCGSEAYFTETTVINKYEKKHNITADTAVDEAVTFTVTEIAPLGHDKLGEKTNIAYVSYLEKGAVSYICTRCNVEHSVEGDAAALFVFNGYSMPEDGRLRLSIGFIVNKEAIAEYELLAETSISYGVACAVADKLNGKAPLDETLEGVSVIKASVSKEFSSFDFVVSGFTAELLDLELVMAAYVTEGDATVYLQDIQTELPTSISVNKYLADKTPVIPEEQE